MASRTIPVTSFIDYLNAYSHVYRRCDVIRITHVKNLNSNVLHEYLHVIVRDRGITMWQRWIVERQTNQDQVHIGLWPWQRFGSSSGRSSGSSSTRPPSAAALLPLLMRSITFQPGLSLGQLARVLVGLHNESPQYQFHSYNCFWYAASVFQMLHRYGKVHDWEWARYRSFIAVPNPYVLSRMKAAAQQFQKAMVATPFSGLMDEEGTESDVAAVEGDEEPETACYEAIVDASNDEEEENNTTLKVIQSVDLIHNIDDAATRTAIEERKADLTAFADHVLASPDREENLKAYYDAFNQLPTQVEEAQASPSPEVDDFMAQLQAAVKPMAEFAPSADEEARFDEAMNTFVGGVLRRLSQAEAAESE